MKPNGLSLSLTDSGPALRVSRPTVAEDAVWEAVKAARDAGWDARRFRREAAQAWEHEAREEAEEAARCLAE